MQRVISILIVTLFITGCSALRRRGSETTMPKTDDMMLSEVLVKNLTSHDFYIQKAEIQYIEDGTEVNIIASLKYKSDSQYLVSLRTRTGIEIARIFISEDTLMINDRIHKKLYCGSSGYLEDKYGITLEALPLLFGDLILDSQEEHALKCEEGISRISSIINSNNISYMLDCGKRKVIGIAMVKDQAESDIKISLSAFQDNEVLSYPGTIELSDVNAKARIRIEIKKIESGTIEKLNFIPGANYERIIVR